MLKEIINYVESVEFEVECGLASSIKILYGCYLSNQIVQQLVEVCKDRAVAIFILGHMLDLTTKKFDKMYRHPHETPITVYLHALTTAQPDLKPAAVWTANRLKNAYWPARYVETYLS